MTDHEKLSLDVLDNEVSGRKSALLVSQMLKSLGPQPERQEL